MKIAIVGAAYTGRKAAEHLKALGHEISVTTTQEARRAELETIADRVVVMSGSDRDGMRELLADQDAVLLTMAGGMVEKDGEYVMDLGLYTDAYVGTAESLVDCLDAAPGLKQIIFTGSWSAYGNGGGDDPVTEDSPATPATPFQQVYVDTENKLFEAQSDSLKVCVFRTGTIYGPNLGFVPRSIESQALPMSGQPIPFDAEAPAAMIHRDDVVRALEFALDNGLEGIYNLINDLPDTKREFFGRICKAHDKPEPAWIEQMSGTGPKSMSNQKIKDAGFSLGDALAEHGDSSFLDA